MPALDLWPLNETDLGSPAEAHCWGLLLHGQALSVVISHPWGAISLSKLIDGAWSHGHTTDAAISGNGSGWCCMGRQSFGPGVGAKEVRGSGWARGGG